MRSSVISAIATLGGPGEDTWSALMLPVRSCGRESTLSSNLEPTKALLMLHRNMSLSYLVVASCPSSTRVLVLDFGLSADESGPQPVDPREPESDVDEMPVDESGGTDEQSDVDDEESSESPSDETDSDDNEVDDVDESGSRPNPGEANEADDEPEASFDAEGHGCSVISTRSSPALLWLFGGLLLAFGLRRRRLRV